MNEISKIQLGKAKSILNVLTNNSVLKGVALKVDFEKILIFIFSE